MNCRWLRSLQLPEDTSTEVGKGKKAHSGHGPQWSGPPSRPMRDLSRYDSGMNKHFNGNNWMSMLNNQRKESLRGYQDLIRSCKSAWEGGGMEMMPVRSGGGLGYLIDLGRVQTEDRGGDPCDVRRFRRWAPKSQSDQIRAEEVSRPRVSEMRSQMNGG